MIGRLTILVGVCCVLVATAATPPGPIQPVPVNPGGPNRPAQPPASASLSSTKAGAKPVELTLKVHYQMVCGQPGPGTVVVGLPLAMSVPRSIRSSAVLVNGKPALSVAVSGHDVTVTLPKRKGVTCLVIGPGTLTLTLTRSAGIGNPASKGTYAVHVRHGSSSFTARVAISA